MKNLKEIYNKYPYPNFKTLCDGILYVLSYVENYRGEEVKRILDVGCGTGEYLLAAAKRYPEKEFVGIDFSEESIKIAEKLQKKNKIKNVELVCTDFGDLSAEFYTFDYVVLSGVLESIEDSWILEKVRSIIKLISGVVGISLKGSYGIGEDVKLLKSIIKNVNYDLQSYEKSVELIRKYWGSVHDKHWIKELLNENLIKTNSQLINLVVGDTFSVEDIYYMLDRSGFHFMRFVDEHLWAPKFYGVERILDEQNYNDKERYEVIAKLRRNIHLLEFFASPNVVAKKDYKIDVLKLSPFGVIQENVFIFFDGTVIRLDSRRSMLLRFFAEVHTLEELKLEVREMMPAVLEEFVGIMFEHGVLI